LSFIGLQRSKLRARRRLDLELELATEFPVAGPAFARRERFEGFAHRNWGTRRGSLHGDLDGFFAIAVEEDPLEIGLVAPLTMDDLEIFR
jgi:hypothetical protein